MIQVSIVLHCYGNTGAPQSQYNWIPLVLSDLKIAIIWPSMQLFYVKPFKSSVEASCSLQRPFHAWLGKNYVNCQQEVAADTQDDTDACWEMVRQEQDHSMSSKWCQCRECVYIVYVFPVTSRISSLCTVQAMVGILQSGSHLSLWAHFRTASISSGFKLTTDA